MPAQAGPLLLLASPAVQTWKLSKHHTLKETFPSFRTNKLRLHRTLQDPKQNRTPPVQCSDGSVQPPPVLSPSITLGASGFRESALIWKSLPICRDSIWFQLIFVPTFGGIEEESKPEPELPQPRRKWCGSHGLHQRHLASQVACCASIT